MAADAGFAGAAEAGAGLMVATIGEVAPGPVAAITGRRDNAWMALTPAERKRIQRARQKAGEVAVSCSSCGARLQPNLRQRADRQGDGLCWSCWVKTPAGLEAERERGKRTREADPERARELGRERARRFRQRASQGDQAQD